MEHREKIREFIQNNLNDVEELAVFNDNENIFEIGLVNSLFAMKLIRYVENEFHVELTPDDMEIENFSTVDNIMKFIREKEAVSCGQV